VVIKKFSKTLYIHIWDNLSLDDIVDLIKKNNITTLIHDSTFEYYLFVTKASYPHINYEASHYDEIQRFIKFVDSNGIQVYFFSAIIDAPPQNINNILESKNINLILFPEVFTDMTVKNTKTYDEVKPKKVLFSNYNGRARLHRCMMIDLLAKYNLLDIGNISWNDLNTHNYIFKYWNKQIIKLEDDYTQEKNNLFDIPDDKYKLSTFDLVSETSMDLLFYTEKTWKPILREKAFIIFGAPGINMKLKEYGYRLFENVIDYSFDSIIDPLERAEAIAIQLKGLSKHDPEQIHLQLTKDVQHNKSWLIKRARKSDSDIAEFFSSKKIPNISGTQMLYL
jgi:hypothetical protein